MARITTHPIGDSNPVRRRSNDSNRHRAYEPSAVRLATNSRRRTARRRNAAGRSFHVPQSPANRRGDAACRWRAPRCRRAHRRGRRQLETRHCASASAPQSTRVSHIPVLAESLEDILAAQAGQRCFSTLSSNQATSFSLLEDVMNVSNPNRKSPKLGFTLVELLVVIAIIGILVACCCRPCRPPAKRRAARSARTI